MLDSQSLARFWAKVNKDGPTMPHMDTNCWLWTGGVDHHGYGHWGHSPSGHPRWKAHRASYELSTGHDPGALGVLHRCDNTTCVRPDHLWAGTQRDNYADAKAKGRNSAGDKHGWRTAPARMPHGSRSPHAKLTEGRVKELLMFAGSHKKAALHFGVSSWVVRDVRSRRTWKHVDDPRLPVSKAPTGEVSDG